MGEIFIFFDFLKSFQNEENHHILIPGLLTYKNSLIWMKNGHMCELSQKRSPMSAMGKIFNFFRFLVKFSKMKEIIIFSLQDN